MELTKKYFVSKTKGHQFKKYIIKKKYCFHIYSFVLFSAFYRTTVELSVYVYFTYTDSRV